MERMGEIRVKKWCMGILMRGKVIGKTQEKMVMYFIVSSCVGMSELDTRKQKILCIVEINESD